MIYKKTITNFIARLSQLVELGASKSDFTKSNKLPKRYFEDTYENISNHYKESPSAFTVICAYFSYNKILSL